MKRNLFIIIIICLLLLASSLALFFSNQSNKAQKAQKESADTIDSLVQICSDHAQQIDNLRTEAAALNTETQKFLLPS